MGDIINTAVIKSKSLMDSSVKDAKEVIGDLGPTVDVLLYGNKTGLITPKLHKKGRKFISWGKYLVTKKGNPFNSSNCL